MENDVNQNELPPAPRRRRPQHGARYARITAKSDNWTTAADGLLEIRAVKTDFLALNYATKCGGIPQRRVVVIYGPSDEGKTGLTLGICGSYLVRDCMVGYLDGEHSLDKEWAAAMVGGPDTDLADFPNFIVPPANRLRHFEDMMKRTDEFFDMAAAADRDFNEGKEDDDPDRYQGSLLVVDSLDSFMPASVIEAALKDFEEHTKKDKEILARGHKHVQAGNLDMRKANINRGWLTRVVSQAAATNTTVIVICHESEYVEEISAFIKVKRKKARGGKAVKFVSSLFMNVDIDPRGGRIMTTKDGKAPKKKKNNDGSESVVGTADLISPTTRYRVKIQKNKVGSLDGRETLCHLYMSTGLGPSPMGIDHVREALHCGEAHGVVQTKGSHWYHGDNCLGNGELAAVKKLNAAPELLDLITRQIFEHEERTREERRHV